MKNLLNDIDGKRTDVNHISLREAGISRSLWESAYKISINMADGTRVVDLLGNSAVHVFMDNYIAKAMPETRRLLKAQNLQNQKRTD
jgi:hypothetical protein